MKKLNRKAFTLVELVIVIAVISIFAAVLIPTFTGIIRSANKSADEQMAASINIHLAMEGKDKILNESDLERVVDEAFGEGTYSNLAPKSAQYGYYFWYDALNNAVVLKSYNEIAALNESEQRSAKVDARKSGPVALAAVTVANNATFAENEKNSFRMFGNYFILDNGGSVIGEALNALKTGVDVAEKVDALTKVKGSSDNKEMATALVEKLKTVAIISDSMTYVLDPDSVTNIYFAPGITTIPSNTYDYIAKAENIAGSIIIPETVETVEENALIFDNSGAVKLKTSYNSAEKIAEVFKANSTNAIIVGASNVEYTIDGGTVSGSDGTSSDLSYGNPVASFEIVTPEDTDYYKSTLGNMYIAYNYSDAIQLGVGSFSGVNEGDVSSKAITWVSDNEHVSVSEDGKISIVGFPDLDECTANITATAVAGDVSRTLTVNIVRPQNVEFTFASGEYDMTIDEDAPVEGITVTYDGSTLDFEFTDFYEDINITGIVDCDTNVSIAAGEGSLFTIKNNVLTFNENAKFVDDEGNPVTQQFTVKIGTALTKTFEVSVNDISAAEFDLKTPFKDSKFLYRVGNGNAVPLGHFFSGTNSSVPATLSIVDFANTGLSAKVNGESSADGTWSIDVSADDWKDKTIQFSGTGVAEINLGGVPIKFEIVDGWNARSYSDFKSGTSIVMLNDIDIEEGKKLAFNNTTLYGNDFTFDVSAGNYDPFPYDDGYSSISENYVISLSNGTLDNVRIVGKVFTGFSATADHGDNICNVLSTGNSRILNSYISYCSAPVRLKDGNLEIVNTTLKGGSIANLDIRGGRVILDNVTTINQKSVVNGTPASEGAVGLGIMVWYECDDQATTITIKNNLTQYNCMSREDFENIPMDYASTFAGEIFKESNGTGKFVYEKDGKQWINTGIFSMTDAVLDTNIKHSEQSNQSIYSGEYVSAYSYSGYLFTINADDVTHVNPTDDYVSAGQGTIYPSFSDVNNSKNNVDKTEGSNVHCYYDNGTIYISFDDGGSKEFYVDEMVSATKGLNTLTLANIYLDGNVVSGSSITFDAAGEHILTFEFDDPYNYDINGNSIVKQHQMSVKISVAEIEPDAKNAEFTFKENNATEKITVNNNTYISATGVSATDKQWGYITVGGQKIFYPIIEAKFQKSLLGEYTVYYYVFNGTVTITDYKDGGKGDALIYNASTTTMPSNLTVVNGMEAGYTDINSACVDISNLKKDGPSGEVWDFSASTTVSGTTKYNGYLAHQSPSGLSIKSGTRDYDAITVAQFRYTDATGASYYYFVGYYMPNQASSSSGGGSNPCVTPDTLVTLADGTQKEIQYVTYEDKLLVWNHHTGAYDVVSAAIIFDHGYDINTVIKLNFSDGTQVKVTNLHQFLDTDLNKYVSIDANTVSEYVGHSFAKQADNGYTTVTLESYEVSEEYIGAYGIISGLHYNILVEGMFSADFMYEDYDLFNYFEIGDDLKFDEVKMQSDIEKYGLYTYEDFADYLTYEQFVGFNVQYFKIAVGKGLYTYEGILDLIEEYLKA